jgi:hypothetical protein
MMSAAKQLKELAETARAQLIAIPDSRAAEKSYTDKWSIKEILGHLVDSATNNHQRIVRMQETQNIGSLTYTQLHWVKSQHYQTEPWKHLVEFWFLYNMHLAHVVAHVDPASLNNMCEMGYAKPATLRFVIEDYIRHVRHHIDQIFSGADPREREQWVRRDPSESQT